MNVAVDPIFGDEFVSVLVYGKPPVTVEGRVVCVDTATIIVPVLLLAFVTGVVNVKVPDTDVLERLPYDELMVYVGAPDKLVKLGAYVEVVYGLRKELPDNAVRDIEVVHVFQLTVNEAVVPHVVVGLAVVKVNVPVADPPVLSDVDE